MCRDRNKWWKYIGSVTLDQAGDHLKAPLDGICDEADGQFSAAAAYLGPDPFDEPSESTTSGSKSMAISDRYTSNFCQAIRQIFRHSN